MAINSPRRLRHRQAKQIILRQFLTFTIRQEQFALPIETVLKVIPLHQIHGDPERGGIGLITYQNQEVFVIDIGCCLFRDAMMSPEVDQQRFLLLLQRQESSDHELIGLPIADPPTLERVPADQVAPLPKNYLHWGNIHGVSSRMITSPENANLPPIFVIDLEQILASLAEMNTSQT
ncbi:chemotaxis protein CheW [Candidatus Synechococcus calcipolaris G9]|uniref:Chemotaxis protein CheW n=1 Tax=Candidatus Synechococcus calcipolaris G9 TaxID=1497997 RepID=A0ABT6F1Y9_9SYNE|nr:chemotaxis protein CheW [Candidatus Synechococcus calcipolaris]MDG2991872.1 chemotaxis protein CheW [Candidatus Synechococcus calcipolaris G9]